MGMGCVVLQGIGELGTFILDSFSCTGPSLLPLELHVRSMGATSCGDPQTAPMNVLGPIANALAGIEQPMCKATEVMEATVKRVITELGADQVDEPGYKLRREQRAGLQLEAEIYYCRRTPLHYKKGGCEVEGDAGLSSGAGGTEEFRLGSGLGGVPKAAVQGGQKLRRL